MSRLPSKVQSKVRLLHFIRSLGYLLLILYSDSLLRHLAKHGNVFKPNPSGRSKRACITCHAGKIKCDGNEKCATCRKKGLECRYRTQDEVQSASPVERGDPVLWPDSTPQRPSAKEQEQPSNTRSSLNTESSGNSAQYQSRSDEIRREEPTSNDPPQNLSLPSPPLFQVPRSTGLLDWSSVKIRADSNLQNSSPPLDPDLETQLDPQSERYLELYYVHFHHRWPIFHRPSLDEEAPVAIVLSSMTMIGAWLEGSLESKKCALNSQEILISEITSQLVRIWFSEIDQTMACADYCANLSPKLRQKTNFNIHCRLAYAKQRSSTSYLVYIQESVENSMSLSVPH